jgi:hypothetical protein
MPLKFETNLGKFINLPNPGLRSYLSVVEQGQPDEYRTPFYKGKSPQDIIEMWNTELSEVGKVWPTLYEFEVDLGKKVGPMSIMLPLKDRMDDVSSYYDLISKDQTPLDERALYRTINEWRQVAGLRLRSQSRVVDLMKKSTNSGSPYFTKRRTVVSKSYPTDVIKQGSGNYFLTKSKTHAAAILGWRGQEGGPNTDDVKQRVVWMFPFEVNIMEMQVYQPLIEASQRFNIVPAWVSMDNVDRRITKLFDTKGEEDIIICTDFSKFDQHFNESCQNAAKNILASLLTPTDDSIHWLANVFPIKYDIPLIIGIDKIVVGKHGMGSGSGGTNADETLVHRALQHEVAILANQELNPNSQCLGDDGVLTFPGCTVDHVVQTYSSHGLDMNPSKQYVSKQDCTYLRRWYHDQYRVDGVCRGVYSTNRAIGRLAEQERYYDPNKWSKEMVALRQLSIIENTKWHPMREQFADFCMKGDKYRLGLDIPGFLDDLPRITQSAIDNIPDFLGYVKSMQEDDISTGIENWWIVNYLKSKR